MRDPSPSKLLLTPRETAQTLGICEKSLWALTAPRGPLPAVRIGRSVRYDVADLRDFIDARKQHSEADG